MEPRAPAYLVPLWEKVARIDRCEPDEESLSPRGDPSPGFISLRSISPPSPTRGEGTSYAIATVRLAPSALTTRTRLPAGASGPATRQMVSSIRTVPFPSTIGFSSVNSRPTSASVRRLRNGLLWLAAPDLSAKRRHSGTAAIANTENMMSCVCQDGLKTNDNNPTSSAASPSQNRNTPGITSASIAIRMKPRINQFQLPRVTNISAITRPPQRCGATGGVGPALGTEPPRRAAAVADAALSPKVARAISPMPASDPRMLVASIGSISTFWFGDSASCPNALIYLSAMK